MSEGVQVVVGEFKLLERDELAAPVRTGGGRVRVDVEPPGHGGLGLPRHRPIHSREVQHVRAQTHTSPRVILSFVCRCSALCLLEATFKTT